MVMNLLILERIFFICYKLSFSGAIVTIKKLLVLAIDNIMILNPFPKKQKLTY